MGEVESISESGTGTESHWYGQGLHVTYLLRDPSEVREVSGDL